MEMLGMTIDMGHMLFQHYLGVSNGKGRPVNDIAAFRGLRLSFPCNFCFELFPEDERGNT